MSCHAIMRAKERYGVELTPDEVEAMERAIRYEQPIALRLSDRRNGKPFYAVRYFPAAGKSRWLLAVLDNEFIITFVERKCVSPEEHKRMESRRKELEAAGVVPKGERRKHRKTLNRIRRQQQYQGGEHAGR